MFNQPPNHQPKADITFRGVLVAFLAVLGISVYTKFSSLDRLYLHYYEYVWGSACTLVGIFVAFTIWQIMKRTKGLSDRVWLLSAASKKAGSIYVGTSHDGVPLYLSEEQRTGHIQILGSTGRGKTESVITSWLYRDLRNGRNAIRHSSDSDARTFLRYRTQQR